jgi:hypothetical protein
VPVNSLSSWINNLNWLNWFQGLDGHEILSVIVTFVIFTGASLLCLAALVAFGVRSGLMAPSLTGQAPRDNDAELAAFFASSMCAFLAVLAMIFLGLVGGSVFAESFLDNALLFPVMIALMAASFLLLVAGAGLARRSIRRRRTASAAAAR